MKLFGTAFAMASIFVVVKSEAAETLEKKNIDAASRSQQSSFLSATIDGELFPVQGKMTISQEIVFQNGMQHFLQTMLQEEAHEKLNIMSATITKHEISEPSGKSPNEQQTLKVQSVVSAQQIKKADDDVILSKSEFGEIVVNLMKIFEDKLKDQWQQNEDASNAASEGMKFELLERIDMKLYTPQVAETESAGSATIAIFSVIGGLLLISLFVFAKRKRNEMRIAQALESASLTEYSLNSNLSPNQNIHTLIQSEDITFEPYNDVRKKTKRQKKNGYSKMSIKRGKSKDYEFELNFSTSSGEDEFVDNQKERPSMELAIDGSALKGECFAPPGKLGVAIDTVNGQPVVHRVRSDSPLVGVLRRLDIIIGVDEVNTSTMTAADVTSLMAKRMGNTRKIIYLRGTAAQDNLKKGSKKS